MDVLAPKGQNLKVPSGLEPLKNKWAYIPRNLNAWFDGSMYLTNEQYSGYIVLVSGDYKVKVSKGDIYVNLADIPPPSDKKEKAPKQPREKKIDGVIVVKERVFKTKMAKKTKKKTFIPEKASELFIERLREARTDGGRSVKGLTYHPSTQQEKYEFRILIAEITSDWVLLASPKWGDGFKFYFYNLSTQDRILFEQATHKDGKNVIWPKEAA